MKNKKISLVILMSILFTSAYCQNSTSSKEKISILNATAFNSAFPEGHTTWNALSTASDGKIYYVLCTDVINVAAQMYSFDPRTQTTEHLADLSELCGEKGMKVVPQGKSHVNFVESKGNLYFATHVGYFDIHGGKEELSTSLSNNYKPYQGGHLLSFNLKTKTFQDLGKPYSNEGIIDMNMDTARSLIYGVSWPTGNFFRYDMASKKFTNLGPISMRGEAGIVGTDYRVLCRSIVINQDNGDVYLTTSEGQILTLELGQNVIKTTINGANLKKDYFGTYDITKAGDMGYNWRQAFWYAPEKMVYGVHGGSGYLFRFDPKVFKIELLDRLTSRPSQLSGKNDAFAYGYLGFKLGPDNHTIYYFTGSPISSGDSVSRGDAAEGLHLITYDISSQKYTDQGLVTFPMGKAHTWCNQLLLQKMQYTDWDLLLKMEKQGPTFSALQTLLKVNR